MNQQIKKEDEPLPISTNELAALIIDDERLIRRFVMAMNILARTPLHYYNQQRTTLFTYQKLFDPDTPFIYLPSVSQFPAFNDFATVLDPDRPRECLLSYVPNIAGSSSSSSSSTLTSTSSVSTQTSVSSLDDVFLPAKKPTVYANTMPKPEQPVRPATDVITYPVPRVPRINTVLLQSATVGGQMPPGFGDLKKKLIFRNESNDLVNYKGTELRFIQPVVQPTMIARYNADPKIVFTCEHLPKFANLEAQGPDDEPLMTRKEMLSFGNHPGKFAQYLNCDKDLSKFIACHLYNPGRLMNNYRVVVGHLTPPQKQRLDATVKHIQECIRLRKSLKTSRERKFAARDLEAEGPTEYEAHVFGPSTQQIDHISEQWINQANDFKPMAQTLVTSLSSIAGSIQALGKTYTAFASNIDRVVIGINIISGLVGDIVSMLNLTETALYVYISSAIVRWTTCGYMTYKSGLPQAFVALLKKAFESKPANEPAPIGLQGHAPEVVDAESSMTKHIFGLFSLPKPKNFSLSAAKMKVDFVNSFHRMILNLLDVATRCFEYIQEKIIGKPISETLPDRAIAFSKAVSKYLFSVKDIDSKPSLYTEAEMHKVTQLLAEGRALHQECVSTPRAAGCTSLIAGDVRSLQNLYNKFKVYYHKETGGDKKAVTLLILGKPGTGKTHMVRKLIEDLSQVCYDHPANQATDLFQPSNDLKYFDGYQGQKFIFLDDIFTTTDTEQRATVASVFTAISSGISAHLNMSSVEDKSSTYFTSDFLLCTSNLGFEKSDLTMMTHWAAITRRFDLMLRPMFGKETIDELAKTSTGSYDTLKWELGYIAYGKESPKSNGDQSFYSTQEGKWVVKRIVGYRDILELLAKTHCLRPRLDQPIAEDANFLRSLRNKYERKFVANELLPVQMSKLNDATEETSFSGENQAIANPPTGGLVVGLPPLEGQGPGAKIWKGIKTATPFATLAARDRYSQHVSERTFDITSDSSVNTQWNDEIRRLKTIVDDKRRIKEYVLYLKDKSSHEYEEEMYLFPYLRLLKPLDCLSPKVLAHSAIMEKALRSQSNEWIKSIAIETLKLACWGVAILGIICIAKKVRELYDLQAWKPKRLKNEIFTIPLTQARHVARKILHPGEIFGRKEMSAEGFSLSKFFAKVSWHSHICTDCKIYFTHRCRLTVCAEVVKKMEKILCHDCIGALPKGTDYTEDVDINDAENYYYADVDMEAQSAPHVAAHEIRGRRAKKYIAQGHKGVFDSATENMTEEHRSFLAKMKDDPNVINAFAATESNLCTIIDRDRNVSLNGIVLRGRTVCAVSHLFPKEIAKFNLTFVSPIVDAVPFTIQNTDISRSNTDLCFFELPRDVASFRDITKNLTSMKDAPTVESEVLPNGLLCTLHSDGVHKLVNSRLVTSMYVDHDPIEYTNNNAALRLENSIFYNAKTAKGDCGAAVYICSPSVPRKLIGLHVAGTKGANSAAGARATPLFREQIQELLKLHAEKHQVSATVKEEKIAKVRLEGQGPDVVPRWDMMGYDPLGSLNAGYGGTDTQFVPSLLHKKVYDVTQFPAKLRPGYNKDGVRQDPWDRANCARTDVFLDRGILTDCVNSRVAHLNTLQDFYERRVLSFDEMVNGFQCEEKNGMNVDEWLGRIEFSTSPGYPWTEKYSNGKREMFTWDVDRALFVANEDVIQATNELEKSLLETEVEPVVFVDTLKDETLPARKVYDNIKTRVFNVGPLHFNLLVRKYFGTMTANVMANHNVSDIAVGTNVHSIEWETLYNYLRLGNDDFCSFAGDYGNWDKSLSFQLCMSYIEVANKWYDDSAENQKCRTMLGELMFSSYRVCHGFLYRVYHSLPSGVPVTAVANSEINGLIIRYIFCTVLKRAYGDYIPYLIDLDRFLRFKTYGDDHVISVAKCISHNFNMLVYEEECKKIGLDYTTAVKTPVTKPFDEKKDISFLKREFIHRDGRIFAPLEPDSIFNMVNWRRKTMTPTEAAHATFLSFAIECLHHGRDFYREHVSKVVTALLKEGVLVISAPYDELFASIWGILNNITVASSGVLLTNIMHHYYRIEFFHVKKILFDTQMRIKTMDWCPRYLVEGAHEARGGQQIAHHVCSRCKRIALHCEIYPDAHSTRLCIQCSPRKLAPPEWYYHFSCDTCTAIAP